MPRKPKKLIEAADLQPSQPGFTRQGTYTARIKDATEEEDERKHREQQEAEAFSAKMKQWIRDNVVVEVDIRNDWGVKRLTVSLRFDDEHQHFSSSYETIEYPRGR